MIRTLSISGLFFIVFLFCGFTKTDASDRNRFTVKPGSVFCKSMNAMHALQNSLSRRDGKANSIVNGGECVISPDEVVVYVIHEEKDIARVHLPDSGKYFWVSKQSLR